LLHLGVDAVNLLHDRRGIGRYARALLRRWLTGESHRVRLTLLLPHVFPSLVRARLVLEVGDGAVVARRNEAGRLDLDGVWYPWNGMTWVAPVRSVATVHDVWPFESVSSDARRRHNEQEPFRTTARVAACILADSNFTKSEIVRHLGATDDKIRVVPLGTDFPPALADADPARIDGAEKYVLFVGEVEGRKNLATLVSAMELLPSALRRQTALVIAGRAARMPSGDGSGDVIVRLEGEVSDARLAALYRGAAAFVFPSIYEGFGLPVLEAMAYGTPVVASDAASVPEAAGDAALFFAATDARALAAQLTRVLTDDALAADLRGRGLRRAASMTWDRCAETSLSAIESTLSE
jgi:glycosyltransferase involved in cell wall biosynthesis